jgi:hypothetical protein
VSFSFPDRPTFVAFVRAVVHVETTLERPTSAACIALCGDMALRLTRYSCVDAKKTPTINAPMTTIAASAIGSAIPRRGVARGLVELVMVRSPGMRGAR